MDDLKIGIKSTALRFGNSTKTWLSSFSALMISSLAMSGYACHQSPAYYMALGVVSGHLARQIYTLDINNVQDCGNKFVSNSRIGLILFLGITLGSYFKAVT